MSLPEPTPMDYMAALFDMMRPFTDEERELGERVTKAAEGLRPLIIWRVEDRRTHLGPYNAEWIGHSRKYHEQREKLIQRLGSEHTVESGHPAMRALFRVLPGGNFLVGMRTLKGLRKWFDGFADDLSAAGFIVAAYRTTVYVEHAGQMAFNPAKENSKRIGIFPVDILKNCKAGA